MPHSQVDLALDVKNILPVPNGGAGGNVNAQTGTSYTIVAGDNRKLVALNNASAVAVTLTSAATLGNLFVCWIENLGAGAVTITPASGTIDGAASLALAQNQGIALYSDGSNFYTERGMGSGSSRQPYDVVCSLVGKPGAGALVLILTFVRAVTFPANFAGSYGTVGVNPTSTAAYTINKNGSSVGTASISTGGVFTFTTTGGASVSFAAGDRMTVVAPSSQDATLSDVGMTFAGTR